MAFYSVHSRSGASLEQAVFVREGFSLGAFIFTVLWALWHRMWLAAAVLLALSGAIALAGKLAGVNDAAITILGLLVNLVFGFEARNLQMRSLIARGYKPVGFSHGDSLEEAEIRYFHARAAREPHAIEKLKPLRYPSEPDTLGIFGHA